MNKKTVMTWVAAATLATASAGAFAHDRDQAALVGGVVGAFAGAVVGQQVSGQNGVLPGVLLGAAAGAAIGSSSGDYGDARPVGYRPEYRPQPLRYVPASVYRGDDHRYRVDDRRWRGDGDRGNHRGWGDHYDRQPTGGGHGRDIRGSAGRSGDHWNGRR